MSKRIKANYKIALRGNKMGKNIIQSIIIHDPFKCEKQPNGNYIMNYAETIIATRVKEIDKYCIEELYKAYKDTPVSSVLVIDMKNFELFLKEYLPIYLKKTEG
jgi:hypothetical protein